ncbi:MAG: glutamine-hydrolyzing GMP synthase [Elusimicrobia bacterium GWA2_61_42]|nr:MAG: glutamine-hydrolyzing GMP synthase [Elusimicrobia bacterium GWA2_61_42]OGR77628.1 MAG: glutamine-hydrolyzing GMP synthase [Elusimicrobia bacterium GWC2_61_25]
MDQILILDFGSQYTQLIARRLRSLRVYCEILPFNAAAEDILSRSPRGIILSGGPSSVYDKAAPRPDPAIFNLGLPVLGVCYGMQLLAREYGGKVAKAAAREYGLGELRIVKSSRLFKGVTGNFRVWMSHGDEVKRVPPGFSVTARAAGSGVSAMENPALNLYALQFHPEVHHTEHGAKMLENFARGVCGYKERWTPASFLAGSVAEIKKRAGGKAVICGLSGGVDSSVAAVLAHRAIGDKLNCIFVDTGLLRHGDRERMTEVFKKKFGYKLKIVDASALFLGRLKGVTSPEKKRKIIGHTFIEVFDREAKKIKGAAYLLQGTLYPDVIESVSVKGPSAVIKSHHNVGGLPARMKLGLIEPLRYFFKDEVRELGRGLKIPEAVLMLHPFPGPGLAIRVLGEVTPDRLKILREADRVMREEILAAGWYPKIWQAFCVLLPVRSVGVMGDERSYEYTIALRCVSSVDGMTADWSRLPHALLQSLSSRIVSEVRGVNRVVYDITSKPPATIEWE